MLTWEGSWPNSLVRRPPWLQACSVKNKTNKIFFTDLTNVFYGLSVSRFMSMMCTACHTNMWLAVMNQVQTSLLSDLNVWNRRPFIAGQVCQQVHFVIFHLQHATHMNWKNAKDLFHVVPFLNKTSCVYNLSSVAFVDPVLCSKVVLRIGFVDDSGVFTKRGKESATKPTKLKTNLVCSRNCVLIISEYKKEKNTRQIEAICQLSTGHSYKCKIC